MRNRSHSVILVLVAAVAIIVVWWLFLNPTSWILNFAVLIVLVTLIMVVGGAKEQLSAVLEAILKVFRHLWQ